MPDKQSSIVGHITFSAYPSQWQIVRDLKCPKISQHSRLGPLRFKDKYECVNGARYGEESTQDCIPTSQAREVSVLLLVACRVLYAQS